MNAFRNALNQNALSTLGTTGPNFTWDNKHQGPDCILEQLDRFTAKEEWISNFLAHYSKNLDFFNSDHRLVLLNTNPKSTKDSSRPTKTFNFEHKWLLEDDYKATIKNLWSSIPRNTTLN